MKFNNNAPWTGHPYTPRAWQRAALPAILQAFEQPRQRGVVVQAVMGAGKSILLTELVHLTHGAGGKVIVVAPRRLLVKQLAKTLELRVPALHIGLYFGGAKQRERRVIVTCNASLPRLASELAASGEHANVIIFDEAHRSETAKILDAVSLLTPRAVVGFTATPWRSNARERLTLFDDVVFSYDFASAIKDGVLCPYRVVTWTEERARAAGVDSDDRDAVCYALIKNAQGPGIISADTVADAKAAQDYLAALDFPTRVITGKTKDAEREESFTALERGDIRAIIHINVLSEGADFPFLRWICLRRTGSSKVRFPQEVGRVLRAYPGKEIATVYDPNGLSLERALSEQADLWRPSRVVAYWPDDAAEVRKMERWLATRDFTSVLRVPEYEGVRGLIDKIVSNRVPRAVIYDCDTLDSVHKHYVRGCSAEWDSDRLVRVEQVVPTPHDRRAITWHDPADSGSLASVLAWVDRLDKDEVARVSCGREGDAQSALSAAGVDAADPQHGALAVRYVDDLPAWAITWAKGSGLRIVETEPSARVVEALRLSPGEAFVHEVCILLESHGYLDRKPVSQYARAYPASESQVKYLRRIADTPAQWSPQAPEWARDKLRPLVIAGINHRLNLGITSDLISLLAGMQRAGGWRWEKKYDLGLTQMQGRVILGSSTARDTAPQHKPER